MNIHFILHETFEVPGAYLKWAQDRGHNITSTKVYEEEILPETVEGIDFLIVMGGPQSPDEDRQAFPYYDPEAEIAFMQKAIAADIYIVGVCLGAQLLSVAYGGEYEHKMCIRDRFYSFVSFLFTVETCYNCFERLL